jgi:alpha-galactosidase
LRPIIHHGVRTPLDSADSKQISFQVTHKGTSLVSVFQQDTPGVSVPENLRLPFLAPDKTYRIEVLLQPENTAHLMKQKPIWMHNKTKEFSGELLSRLGLPLPVLDPESLVVLRLDVV